MYYVEMSWIINIGWCLSVISCVSGQYYDCRRSTQPCLNSGTCNTVTGDCSCVPQTTFFGHDCAESISQVVIDATLQLPCENNGVSVRDGPSGARCHCPEVFHGTLCDTRRAVTNCSGDSLTITIVPIPPFPGMVLIKNNRSNTACDFTKTTNADGVDVYTNTLGFSSGCSIIQTPDKPKVGETTYTVKVLIQYSPIFETFVDVLIDASCVHRDSGQSSVSGGVGEINVDQQKNLTEDQTSTTYNPVSFAVQKDTGMPITPPLYLGSPLRLYFPLADTNKFTSMVLESCDALNGLDAPTAIRENIIKDGCPTMVGKSIITGNIIYDTNIPAIIVKFNAFRFSNSPVVSFDCSVRVCTASETTCTRPTCNRKRRSASQNNTTIAAKFSVHDTVMILDATDTPNESTTLEMPDNSHTDKQVNTDACLTFGGLLSVMIVLVIAVVFLLVITLCFAVRFMKSRGQVQNANPPPYFTSEKMGYDQSNIH